MVRKILRTAPYFSDDDIKTILELMESSLRTRSLTMGPLAKKFEEEFAKMIEVKHAIAVNSGTAALEIVMRSIGVIGKEVIIPTQTFVASANSVILAGGKPVFAEINKDTLCLDFEDTRRRITSKTAAIMLVPMAGLIPPDVEKFAEICHQHGLSLIEDDAHAHGATINNKYAGNLGRAGCFSFFATKVMTSAEGGMVTTNDDQIAELALSFRNHGANLKGTDYIRTSTNWRLSEFHAAIGLIQLRSLKSFVEKRNQIATQYNAALNSVKGIQLLPTYPNIKHSYWNYILLLEKGIDRTKLASVLQEKFGVPIAWPYDPPCHLQPVFRNTLGYKLGDLPKSEEILNRHIILPMHFALSDEDVEYIVDSFKSALKIMFQ